jgi:uncharacterized protein
MRDLAPRLPPERMRRLWQICAHLHGSLLNLSKLSGSLGVTGNTVRSYIDLLQGTFMLRVLPSDTPNVRKRLVRTRRVYVRDTGILHALLSIRTHDDLFGHPVYGASFEGFAIEQLLASARGYQASFYRTSSGAEMDLVLRRGSRTLAFEFKASSAPRVSRGFWNALDDLQPDATFVVAPVDETWPLAEGVRVVPPTELHALVA